MYSFIYEGKQISTVKENKTALKDTSLCEYIVLCEAIQIYCGWEQETYEGGWNFM